MTVVSYFTRNGNYPALAERLANSCRRLGLNQRIVELRDTGQWKSANNLKAGFIQQRLFELRHPVLWVDVDCEIMQMPMLLWQDQADFAAYNWHADPQNVQRYPYDPARLNCSGGVLYFRYTAAAVELLTQWRALLDANPHAVDDQILSEVYNSTRPPVHPLWLPKTYNFMTQLFGEPTPDVVIRHDYAKSGHREPPAASDARLSDAGKCL